ncbi:MAG TPA: LysM peptidoglycan-binding domain-containing protein [Flavobacterium sp.]
MIIKNISLCLTFFLLAVSSYGQDSKQKNYFKENPDRIYLDSIKSTFNRDNLTACVDSLWMKELTSLDLYNNLASDIKNINMDEKVDYELSTELLKTRLKEMDAKSPFNIEYNQALENLIKSFLKNRKKAFERLMAISEYYFPLFEESLAKKNVPLEIKYLAVVESALNPKAVSRVGATGLWQFMYQTGKQYNLNIDSYVDERSDPLKSSEAAAQYMSNMYRIFGDWDLVLASYNSGPGNVAKAIRRSGGQQNFWNIKKNLPKETQGYVPAFLATMYIYEYHKEHGIVPKRAAIKNFETDTIMIKKQMSFKQISDLLDVSVAQLQLLNPSYKMNVVPVYNDKKHYLRLPSDKIPVFTSNEEKIYAYIDHEADRREKPFQPESRLASRDSMEVIKQKNVIATYNRVKYHKVKRGENLEQISSKYGVSMASLRKWNKLRLNKAPVGKSLKVIIFDSERIAVLDQKVVKTGGSKNLVATPKPEKATAMETTDTEQQYYIVQKGDNLSNIARNFGVTVEDLKQWNNMEDTNVLLDTKIKIVKSANAIPTTDNNDALAKNYYTVKEGDNLNKIARSYNVTVAQLQEWNKLEDTNVKLGSRLLVLSKELKPSNEAVASTSKNNKNTKNTIYLVQKGDSLYKIANKYPGVTVSDLKTWNDIKANELKPGMKLKISG